MQFLSSLPASSGWMARAIAVATLLACMSGGARAGTLIGTQVELTAQYFGPPNNFTVGPLTATIADPLEEFAISLNGPFTANFTDTTLTITFAPTSMVITDTFTFRDSAFAGLTLTEVSNSFDSIFFPGQKSAFATLTGDTLTFGIGLSSISGSATYSFAPSSAVPEPSSLALLGLGGLGLLSCRLRRKRRAA